MNISSSASSTSSIVNPPSRAWSRSRSQTDPLIVNNLRQQPLGVENIASQTSKRKQSLDSSPATKAPSSQDSILPKSPAVPASDVKTDNRVCDYALLSPALESIPATPIVSALPSGSTPDNRSTSQRRAPASHSSYGVGTLDGPPPSFSTQRTLSQDRLWKPGPPDKSNTMPKQQTVPTYEEPESLPIKMQDEVRHRVEEEACQQTLDIDSSQQSQVHNSSDDQDVQNTGGVKEAHSTETFYTSAEEPIQELDVASTDEASGKSGSEDRKSEDLFLNLARTDASGSEVQIPSERRSSRSEAWPVSLVSESAREGRREAPPPGTDGPVNDATSSPRTQLVHSPNRRPSMGSRPGAASAHPAEVPGRQRYLRHGWQLHASRAQSVVGQANDEGAALRGAMWDDSGSKSRRRSNMSAFGTDRTITTGTTDPPERPKPIDYAPVAIEGTESTMSTTAPSTVWDELDELKSRIRRLELTGKLPSSSAAAMSSVERPRTAATTVTTVTTMSSSPNHGRGSASAEESALDGVPATVHPLLREALRKSRPLLSSEIYQKLEATASDALQLASAMGAGTQDGHAPAYDALSSTERQLRRRADSMCRGLTELALALSSGPCSPNTGETFQPGSNETATAPGHPSPATSHRAGSASRFGRRASAGTHDAHLSTVPRIQSRLESRRSSLLPGSLTSSPHEHVGSELVLHTPPSVQSFHGIPSVSSGRRDREASCLRNRRTLGTMEGVDDSENDQSPSVRPVSRARTEVSLRHRRARDRTSLGREYTSSHPLPNSTTRKEGDSSANHSPSALSHSGLQTRRSHASSTGRDGSSSHPYSPATPRDHIQPGYRRYVSASVARDVPNSLSSGEYTPDQVSVSATSVSGPGPRRRSLGFSSRLGQMGNYTSSRSRASAKSGRERRDEGLQGQTQDDAQSEAPARHVTRPSASNDRLPSPAPPPSTNKEEAVMS